MSRGIRLRFRDNKFWNNEVDRDSTRDWFFDCVDNSDFGYRYSGQRWNFYHPCVEYARWKKIGLFFIFVLLFFFIVNWKKIMENSRWRLVGNLLLVNGMIEQLIARNYSVLYAYKARQRLNRLFMISKFIFCVSFFFFFIRFDAICVLFCFYAICFFFFLLISLK